MDKPVYKAHLTENHQLKAADALIAQLRQRLGESDSYISELEDTLKNKELEISQLNNKVTSLENKCSEILNRYSRDYSNQIKTDVLYQKCQKTIKEMEKKVIHTIKENNYLINELIKLRNERNN